MVNPYLFVLSLTHSSKNHSLRSYFLQGLCYVLGMKVTEFPTIFQILEDTNTLDQQGGWGADLCEVKNPCITL